MASRALRRASIAPLGIDDECEANLVAHDSEFFGDNLPAEACASDSEGEEEGASSLSPAAKRLHTGTLRGEASDDSASESDKTMEVDPLNDSFLSAGDCDVGDVERALIAADIRDWQSTGCGCKSSNCYTKLDADKLEDLVLSIRHLDKKYHKQYVVGQLSASMRSTAESAKQRDFYHSYHILGQAVCSSVYMEVNGIGEHIYRQLKNVAEECFAEVPAHGSAGRLPYNAITSTQAEHVTAFIRNTASVHGLPQPAAPRGRADIDQHICPLVATRKQSSRSMRKLSVLARRCHITASVSFGKCMHRT